MAASSVSSSSLIVASLARLPRSWASRRAASLSDVTTS